MNNNSIGDKFNNSGGVIGNSSGNTTNSNNSVSNTTINFFGPQFIVNAEGRSLDLSMSDRRSVISHPFHGGSNQQWTILDNGSGKVALKSEYNGMFVSVDGSQRDAKLVATKDPFYWDISRDEGSYKLNTPNTGLALSLGSSASLRPLMDQSTQVYILDDTPENRETIKKGEIVPTKQLATSVQQPTPVGNLNVTINDFSGSGSVKVADAVKDLQKFLASDTARNLVIFFGHSPNYHPEDSVSHGHQAAQSVCDVGDRSAVGFPSTSYFQIQARGANNVLLTCAFESTEGVQIQLWPRPTCGAELRASAFFIDRTGALCHGGSGLAVDIMDDVPVLRRRRPASNPPNPWSHPLPQFSYTDSQISVRFLSDPSMPSCSQQLYPNESWRSGHFILATKPAKTFHMHPLSDFAPWAPRAPFPPLPYSVIANYDRNWRVLVEGKQGNSVEGRTQWDIVPLTA